MVLIARHAGRVAAVRVSHSRRVHIVAILAARDV